MRLRRAHAEQLREARRPSNHERPRANASQRREGGRRADAATLTGVILGQAEGATRESRLPQRRNSRSPREALHRDSRHKAENDSVSASTTEALILRDREAIVSKDEGAEGAI